MATKQKGTNGVDKRRVLALTPFMEELFWTLPAQGFNRICVPKGGRSGATVGAAVALCIKCYEGEGPILWGDTTQANVFRIVDTEFLPALKKIDPSGRTWHYSKNPHQLHIGNSFIDFRYEAQPQNWEGFKYRWIFINEAGIVLRKKYLYTNAVAKMLMDYPESIMIAAGVPKGKATYFYELCEKAKENKTGRWKLWTVSTHINPFISPDQIKVYETEMGPELSRQEIYGEFSGGEEDEFTLFPQDWREACYERHQQRLKIFDPQAEMPDAIALDPAFKVDGFGFAAGYSNESGVLDFADAVGEIPKGELSSSLQYASVIDSMMQRRLSVVNAGRKGGKLTMDQVRSEMQIKMDYTGNAEGVYAALAADAARRVRGRAARMNFGYKNVVPLVFSAGTSRTAMMGKYLLGNIRADIFWSLREMMDLRYNPTLCLPYSRELDSQLAAIRYYIKGKRTIMIEDKDKIKARLGGKSTDLADVVAILFSNHKKKKKVRSATL